MRHSIRKRLTLVFIGLAVGPLLLVGAVLAWQSFVTQQQQALNLQQEMARRVATEVTAFFEGLEDELRVVSRVQGLQGLDRTKQQEVLSELLSYNDVFETLILLDSIGQEQINVSRASLVSPSLGNRAETDEFIVPQTTGEVYYSPVRFEETTGEPLMTVAVPLLNVRTGLVDAVLVSDIRIKKIWELIANVRVEGGQSIYIVDTHDKVVAHRNPSIVLRGTSFNVPDQDGIQPGLTGANAMLSGDMSILDRSVIWLVKSITGGDAVLAVDTVKVGQQEFNIIAEQTVSEALALAVNTVLITAGLVVAALVVASGMGIVIVYQLVRQIQMMAKSAEAISAGDLSQQVEITSQDELGILAKAFNSMTAQLRNLINNLETRIVDRTRRLEIVATLGEQLNAILDFDLLLLELVNQVKDTFGYYHAHVYVIDEDSQDLVMAAGAGKAGIQMKAQGHRISVEAPTSLVARAARTNQIVSVENVREAPDWLPNPLLPDTYSEMAVPIVLEGQVVGVLDVQQDKVAGLDEGDAGLLRSLANQVAVAINNARLFAEVETALADARAAQEKYIEQAWEKAKSIEIGAEHLHVHTPSASGLPETTMVEAKKLAFAQDTPALVTLEGLDLTSLDAASETPGNIISKSIVAPVILGGKTVGALQMHRTDVDDKTEGPPWNEEDLALIETILGQVAQSAENLRLFEDTRGRASREQIIRQITEKMRAATSLEELIQTTTNELGQQLNAGHVVLDLGLTADEKA